MLRCRKSLGPDTRGVYSWLRRRITLLREVSSASPLISTVLTLDCGYSNRFTGIPEDDEGLNITILKSEIEKCETEQETEKPNWQKWTYRYVFYGVPTFSNPTGSVMSLERRKELVDVFLLRCRV